MHVNQLLLRRHRAYETRCWTIIVRLSTYLRLPYGVFRT